MLFCPSIISPSQVRMVLWSTNETWYGGLRCCSTSWRVALVDITWRVVCNEKRKMSSSLFIFLWPRDDGEHGAVGLVLAIYATLAFSFITIFSHLFGFVDTQIRICRMHCQSYFGLLNRWTNSLNVCLLNDDSHCPQISVWPTSLLSNTRAMIPVLVSSLIVQVQAQVQGALHR